MSIRKALTIGGGLAVLVWAVGHLLEMDGDSWKSLIDHVKSGRPLEDRATQIITGGFSSGGGVL